MKRRGVAGSSPGDASILYMPDAKHADRTHPRHYSPLPRSANLGRRTLLQQGRANVGRRTHTKTDVVVTVVGIVPVADGGACIVCVVDPRAAAQHTTAICRGARPETPVEEV